MTSSQDNTPPDSPPAAMRPMTPQQAQEAILQNFVWPVLCTTVNGLRLSLQQVPLPHLLVTACGLFGRVIGETVSIGSLTDVLQIRAACIKAFSEGVRGVRTQPGPMPGENILGQKMDS